MEKLKPCPFCGGEASAEQSHYNGKWFVACQDEPEHNVGHFENGGRYPTKEEAVNEWNRHAAPENKALTLEQLRGMEGEPVYSPQCRWGIIGSRKIGTDDHGGYDKKYTVGFSYGWEWLDDVMRIGPLYARKPGGSKP